MSPAEAREAANAAGLCPQFLGKSVWADGRAGSHGLVVIKDFQGLLLRPPFFSDHFFLKKKTLKKFELHIRVIFVHEW